MTPSSNEAARATAQGQDPRHRRQTIVTLALPIVGGMVSQNVLNLVDTGMVGTLGDAALAAVGTASFANFMAMAFIMGLATGVQAMVARRKGEGKDDQTAVPLNGGLLLALLLGVPWSVALIFAAPTIFPFLNDDPQVIAAAVPYWQARLFALTSVGMNFAFRGYWNGVNRSGLYLRTLLVMHATNIFLNWVFIFGNLGAPALGAMGAGVGSAIATWIGTVYYVYLGMRHARGSGFLVGLPARSVFKTMLRLSVPTGVQQFFFSAGFTAMFWIVGRIGTAETAAATVLINVTLVAILPGIALGLTAASLVGQALGRSDPEDARRWGWDVARIGVVALACLGLPMLLLPDLILSVFIRDPETLAIARLPLRLVGAGIAAEGVGLVLMHALLGAGATRLTMAVSIGFQWGLFLPLAYLAGPVLGFGLVGVWGAQIGYRGLQALVMARVWSSEGWTRIQV
jgi:multidrug resistance protein, MATE family